MRRQLYFPVRIAEQVPWLELYAWQLPEHGPTCGVSAGDIAASVNDARYAAYVLGAWLVSVRPFSRSTTVAAEEVLTGDGASAMVLPTFTVPELPEGVTEALPGTLTRIFALIAKMKLSAGYNTAIGKEMGIVGSRKDPSTRPLPRVILEVLQSIVCQFVRVKFFKYMHMGVCIESRRGNGDWEFLGIGIVSHFDDARPLLVAGQPEIREYRVCFWDKGTPNGEWTPVRKVTVSP